MPCGKHRLTIFEAFHKLEKEYDVVTREMVMSESGASGQHFDDMERIYKKAGFVYSPKHHQYKVARVKS